MRFKHQIKLVSMQGESILVSRWFSNSFTRSAYSWFHSEAINHFPCMIRVKDSTVAGVHYRNLDGTVVLELR